MWKSKVNLEGEAVLVTAAFTRLFGDVLHLEKAKYVQ